MNYSFFIRYFTGFLLGLMLFGSLNVVGLAHEPVAMDVKPERRNPADALTPATAPPGRRAWQATGRVVEYDLEVAEQVLSPAGKSVRVLTINRQFPGPTLRFNEGDVARIRLHNSLANDETSLHWHGLLLPNDQDGVPHLTTPPVAPGGTFTYEFPVRQSGTYWYHSHTGMQEQRGVLGSIVVLPRKPDVVHADRDQVLVLNDWTNESPQEVLRTLKRGSNWYSIQKGAPQSLLGAVRAGFLGEYVKREGARLPPMDVADVAYDAFLVNGQRRFQVEGKPGETIRLRVINASASSYFYVESSTGPLTIVAADGPAVEPVSVQRLLIGIAETYDVLVKVPSAGSWEIRATAHDGTGFASAFVGTGPLHEAPNVPRPNLYNMDELLMPALEEGDLAQPREEESARSGAHSKGAGDRPGICKSCAERPLPPYRQLRARQSTALAESLPRRTLALHLTGDMQRYVWSLNQKTMSEESTIPVKRGEVLRLELINDTMMHHPMHLHGHFFRLLNGQGDYSPLKHTVDVPPMSRRIIEFEANEEGDWLFHCHVLYHMMEGMGRVMHYGPASEKPMMGEHGKDMRYAFADFNALSNMSSGQARIQQGRNSLLVPWELGWRRTDGLTEYEVDALGERVLSSNLGVVGGMRLSNMHPVGNRPLAGGWYRLPYLVMGMATVDAKGAVRLMLSKDFQLTSRLNVQVRGQYDTRQHWQEAVRADYTLSKTVALSAAFHTDYGFGAGLSFRF
jgi:FtsP/CotA-like multicopper oxidase with cupredoxin domain